MKKLKALLGSRLFRQGSLSSILMVLFVAVIVLLNVVVTMLSERYNLRIDLTADQAFVLTDDSKEFLAGLEEEITIYLLSPEQTLASSGDYFLQASEVIKQYAVLSDKVTVKYVDLTRNPGFAQNYPQYQLSTSTIILESGGRDTTLTIFDLFHVESDHYQNYYIVSSQAEQAMTSAMMSLVMPHPPTVSVLTGFGESGADQLVSLLSQNRFAVVEQNLLTEEINPDASLVVISAPSRDYAEEVLDKLEAWLYNDGLHGRSLLYFAGLSQEVQTPNLDAFLADWGLAVDAGAVFQTDTSRLLVESYYWSLVEYADEHLSEEMAASQLYTVVPEARPLTALYAKSGQREVTELLRFDEGVCVDDLSDEWLPSSAERWGPIPAMLLSTQTGYDDNETVTSHVLVCGSERMMDSYLMESPYIGNAEVLLHIVNDLVKRDGVTITPKTIGGAYLPATEFHIALIAAIFVVILPLMVLVAGGAVFVRRKHL